MIDAETSAQPMTESELRKTTDQTRNCAGSGMRKRADLRTTSCRWHAARYTGVEIADSVIADNRKRFQTASWHVGTCETLPVPRDSQDCVFAYYVLEHCAFPQRFLESLLDKVKPGGRLLLTFPDMVVSRIFGSQALGWDRRRQRSICAVAHLSRIASPLGYAHRLPAALRRARQTVGAFPVNLSPQCFEPGIKIEPDIDAIYIASRAEVQEWAQARGCLVRYPGAQHRDLITNVLIEIIVAELVVGSVARLVNDPNEIAVVPIAVASSQRRMCIVTSSPDVD